MLASAPLADRTSASPLPDDLSLQAERVGPFPDGLRAVTSAEAPPKS